MAKSSSHSLRLLFDWFRFVATKAPHSPIDRYKLATQTGRFWHLFILAAAVSWIAFAATTLAAQEIAMVGSDSEDRTVAGDLDTSAVPPQFRAADGTTLDWETIRQIRFSSEPRRDAEYEGPYRFKLVDGSQFTGALVSLDGNLCRVRTETVERQFAVRWLRSITPNYLHRKSTDPLGPLPGGGGGGNTVVLLDGQEIHHAEIRFAQGVFSAGTLSLADSKVAMVRFEQNDFTHHTGEGLHIRVFLADELPNEGLRDGEQIAECSVGSTSSRCFVGRLTVSRHNDLALVHPALGQMRWDRSQVARLEILFFGEQIVFLPSNFQLGNELRTDMGQIRPSGSKRQIEFVLDDTLVSRAWISMRVQGMEAQQPGGRFERLIESGCLRTNLLVNGQAVDYLNRHLAHAPRQCQRIRIPLPSQLLTAGTNRLLLSQSSLGQHSDELDDCGIYDLAIELDVAP